MDLSQMHPGLVLISVGGIFHKCMYGTPDSNVKSLGWSEEKGRYSAQLTIMRSVKESSKNQNINVHVDTESIFMKDQHKKSIFREVQMILLSSQDQMNSS